MQTARRKGRPQAHDRDQLLYAARTVAVERGFDSLRFSDVADATGVPVSSLASMTLNKGGVATSPFSFEDDIVAALANREIEAAAVTPATVGWFNLQHADKPLRLIPAFENDPDLNWNIAAGLIRPDDRLRARVDAAIEALLADGTIARIYAGYGIALRPPQ